MLTTFVIVCLAILASQHRIMSDEKVAPSVVTKLQLPFLQIFHLDYCFWCIYFKDK